MESIAYVHPWTGILANLKESNKKKLEESLQNKSYKFSKIKPLRNDNGFTGYALVHFHLDWTGFENAMLFDKEHAKNQREREEWENSAPGCGGIYGWIATTADHERNDDVCRALKRYGDIMTVQDVVDRDKRHRDLLIKSLAKQCKTVIETDASSDESDKSDPADSFPSPTSRKRKAEEELDPKGKGKTKI